MFLDYSDKLKIEKISQGVFPSKNLDCVEYRTWDSKLTFFSPVVCWLKAKVLADCQKANWSVLKVSARKDQFELSVCDVN